MRTSPAFWVALFGLAGCIENFGVSESGVVGIGVDEPDDPCRPTVSAGQIELYGPDASDTVTVTSECGQAVEVSIDDPDAAFDLQPSGRIELEPGTPESLDVQIVATEPGTYEAQILVDGDFGVRTVEVFASIEQE